MFELETSPQNLTSHVLINPSTHPNLPPLSQLPHPIVFLSGTTNFNAAHGETRWQSTLFNSLVTSPTTQANPPPSCTIIDPYNPTWSSTNTTTTTTSITTWAATLSNPVFHSQVNWELEAQTETADIVIVAFCGEDVRSGKIGVGGTSLCELGIAVGGLVGREAEGKAKGKKIMVCVEEGYWKEGYVKVLCERFAVPCFQTLGELEKGLREVVEGFKV